MFLIVAAVVVEILFCSPATGNSRRIAFLLAGARRGSCRGHPSAAAGPHRPHGELPARTTIALLAILGIALGGLGRLPQRPVHHHAARPRAGHYESDGSPKHADRPRRGCAGWSRSASRGHLSLVTAARVGLRAVEHCPHRNEVQAGPLPGDRRVLALADRAMQIAGIHLIPDGGIAVNRGLLIDGPGVKPRSDAHPTGPPSPQPRHVGP